MIPDPRNPHSEPASVLLGILAKKPRLSIKDLHEFFQAKYKPGLTLQGFYNLVRKLVEERVLVKEGKLISIDAAWIYNLMDFSETLQRTYFGSEAVLANILLAEGEQKTFSFPNPVAMDNFWTHALVVVAQYNTVQRLKNPHAYAYTDHAWFQLVRTSQEHVLNHAYARHKMQVYHLIGSRSFLDGLTPKLVSQRNVHVKFGRSAAFSANSYVQVMGDFIFETSLPPYIHKMLDEKYSEVTAMSLFKPEEFLEILTQPGKTELKLSRDHARAERLRASIKKYF